MVESRKNHSIISHPLLVLYWELIIMHKNTKKSENLIKTLRKLEPTIDFWYRGQRLIKCSIAESGKITWQRKKKKKKKEF